MPALYAAVDVQVNVVSAVDVSDLGCASACSEWSISDVLNHSFGVTQKFTAFALGDTDSPRTPPGDLLGDDLYAAARETATQSQNAWARADPSRVCHLPFADVDCDVAAAINLYDVMAHTWDVAVPLGIAIPCGDDLWTAAWEAARTALDIGRDVRHFAAPIAISANAGPRTTFLALLGRTSR